MAGAVRCTVRKAEPHEAKEVSRFIDRTFTREGYGFVTSAQVATEAKRGAVFIAEVDGEIAGCRIGLNRIYNLCVRKDIRGAGVGRALVEAHEPEVIRVKSQPVGNLSKAQRENFVVPDGFYESLGYRHAETDYARNFYQRGRSGEPAHFHKKGKVKHIKIYTKSGELPSDDEKNQLRLPL